MSTCRTLTYITRNHLIYDAFSMTFSKNVTDSQLWVPSPKIMTFYQFFHSPAQNIVTFKQIRHEQHLNIMTNSSRTTSKHHVGRIEECLGKKFKKLFCNKG